MSIKTPPVMAEIGRGCVKTQNRSLEIVSKLGEFSVEVSCLLTRRYRLVSQSIASHGVFEGDFWGDTVVEFSHSLGRLRTREMRKTALKNVCFPPESGHAPCCGA
jgi:hypothetical protein